MSKRLKHSVSTQKLENVARLAARQAAKILRTYYRQKVKISFKGAVDLVTEADLKSQATIVRTISKAFPEHQILAEEEEFGHNRSLNGPIWIIDPLDGTTNFAHRFPMFAISIAFRDKGKTRFGLIYHPLLNELFIAHRGKGARLNGKKIHVAQKISLSNSLLATGFPYDRRTSQNNNLDLFCHFELTAQCVRRAGAATLDLAYLACGRLDGFWEPGLAPWDIAAGSLLVEEAGGVVTDYSGNPIHDLWCKEIVAGNPKIHSQIVTSINQA